MAGYWCGERPIDARQFNGQVGPPIPQGRELGVYLRDLHEAALTPAPQRSAGQVPIRRPGYMAVIAGTRGVR